jgi:hypothetical protein
MDSRGLLDSRAIPAGGHPAAAVAFKSHSASNRKNEGERNMRHFCARSARRHCDRHRRAALRRGGRRNSVGFAMILAEKGGKDWFGRCAILYLIRPKGRFP